MKLYEKILLAVLFAGAFRYFTLLLSIALNGSWTIQEPSGLVLYNEIALLFIALVFSANFLKQTLK